MAAKKPKPKQTSITTVRMPTDLLEFASNHGAELGMSRSTYIIHLLKLERQRVKKQKWIPEAEMEAAPKQDATALAGDASIFD